MLGVSLHEVAILLAALAIAGPLARWLGISEVLGYLVVGLLLGPNTIGWSFSDYKAKEILHFAEFGIVLLLFLIGLELRPKRLWAMRNAVFVLGAEQVIITGLLLAGFGLLIGLSWQAALFAGLALALSSTALALQVMEETGDLQTRHGRLGFSVLLFQDLAAIPLIAFAPLFAVSAIAGAETHTPMEDVLAVIKGLGLIAVVVVVGHFVLDYLLRLVARTRVREAMTAAALLTVVGVTIVMQQAGLSASLGAFIAGALLAESSYRHQLEADIQPFEGLLLGLFFTAIGMTIDVRLFLDAPWIILILVAGLVAIKAGVLYVLGRFQGLEPGPARRLGIALSQGGEFAFVLFTVGYASGALTSEMTELLTVVVTLSMAATPILLKLEGMLSRRRKSAAPIYDSLPDNDGHVIIAGFGRFGQIVARILTAKKIPFTALDISAEQVEFVRRFGAQAFYGDASRPDILEAADADKARALVLAIDDVEASMRTAELVRSSYPDLPIFARARNRNHAHRLLDLGITDIQRETFLSSLDITKQLLKRLGLSEREAGRIIHTFRTHDERRLVEDYKLASDLDRLRERARSDVKTLEKLFEEDAAEEVRLRELSKTEEGAR
ncbi:cation:proton antiporter [Hyphomicrobium sp. NDB2Meth4]|uniref:cation:proton antiporter domain-containing protein n=1 Tax=Hyphomicrobium sp. NDB2Meth4 TaxID=1892846 RepID=UPI0009313691|nr:cation:proton antiporter [Hyphomicrobium sp. NDB2Meth4]